MSFCDRRRNRTEDSCVQGKCVSHLYHQPISCGGRIRTYVIELMRLSWNQLQSTPQCYFNFELRLLPIPPHGHILFQRTLPLCLEGTKVHGTGERTRTAKNYYLSSKRRFVSFTTPKCCVFTTFRRTNFTTPVYIFFTFSKN